MNSVELMALTAFCGGLAALGFYCFYRGFSRLRSVEDTAASRIASAAQGYAELCGEAFKLEEVRELFAHAGVSCLWYRSLGEDNLEANASGTQQPFGIRDESGYAVVLPYRAQVESVHRHRWKDDSGRAYAEDRIYAGDRLYIVGEFTSSEPGFDLEKAVADKLLQWREDPAGLLERFDTDHDGRIDAQEDWKMRMQALQQAQAEEDAAITQYRAVNLIKSPADGRAFVISTRPRRSLNQRLLAWELVGIVAFLAGIVGAGYFGALLLSHPLI